MKSQAVVVTPHDYPRAMNVLGARITVLAPIMATHGYEITCKRAKEGVGPPNIPKLINILQNHRVTVAA